MVLPKSMRIKGYKCFNYIYRHGNRYHDQSMLIRVVKADLTLQKYKSEVNNFPHPRSIEALDVIAKKWGTVSGFKSAEAFYLLRELNN